MKNNADMSSWLIAFVIGLVVFAIVDGFKRLAGNGQPKKRIRQVGQSLTDFLLGPVMRGRTTQGLAGMRVRIERSPSAVDEWSLDVAPPLAADGQSHLWLGTTLSRWVFPDIVIRPDPVEIRAPPSEVWEVFLDFDSYGEWNGYVQPCLLMLEVACEHVWFVVIPLFSG